MEYNTTKPKLIISEYGRIMQEFAQYCASIEDREKRTKVAHRLVDMMVGMNPQLRNMEDYRHKLWDHLQVISDYSLDVDAPYPLLQRPDPSEKEKLDPVPYPISKVKYKHYGKNMERLLDRIPEYLDQPEKMQSMSKVIAYYMGLVYKNWNNEQISDETLMADFKLMTGGQLEWNTSFNLDSVPKTAQAQVHKQGKKKFKNKNNFRNKRRY